MAGAVWMGGMTMSAVSAASNSVEIAQGRGGQVAADHVGVAWIADDGSSATVVVAGKTGGAAWEVQSDVRAGTSSPSPRLARAASGRLVATGHAASP